MNGTGAAAGMNLAAWSHGEPVWGGGRHTHQHTSNMVSNLCTLPLSAAAHSQADGTRHDGQT
jgi:hypothetical protein